MTHPLDRPVWSALTSERQAALAVGAGGALRLAPGYGVFAASMDQSPQGVAAIAALDQPEGMLATVEADPTPVPPGLRVLKEAVLSQMVLVELTPAKARDIAIEPLTEADAPAMLALATLTEPGPFFERTHRLGDFFGVKQDGRLLAMAGERLKPDGFTEVSGVCAQPRRARARLCRRPDAGGDRAYPGARRDGLFALLCGQRRGHRPVPFAGLRHSRADADADVDARRSLPKRSGESRPGRLVKLRPCSLTRP